MKETNTATTISEENIIEILEILNKLSNRRG